MTAAAESSQTAASARPWVRLSYGYAALVVLGLAYSLVDLPIQVSDSYGNMVKASYGTLGSLVAGEFHQTGYLRPLLWAHLRIVQDWSGGQYYEWFRGWHVAQVVALTLLFVHLVRPRRWSDVAALPLGLAALIGIHTFAGTVREAFPINTFMTILLCSFAAADLALGPPRWWRDVAAGVIFVFAALTVETGLLVAVIVVAARLAGAKGVSWPGALLQALLVAGYFVLRFVVLQVGSPQLDERSSGFGFSNLDPADLIARFGPNPLPFYAYNVASSLLSLFAAEPRGGVWLVTRDVLNGDWAGAGPVNVIASALGSAVILGYMWTRRRDWLAWRTDRGDQLVIVFVAVALANAVFCYAYTKDVILSPAGAFFAVALTVAAARLLESASTSSVLRATGVAVVMLLLSVTWATRVVGAHLGLRHSAAVMRQEWAYVDQLLERESVQPTEPAAIRLKRQLQDDAVRRYPLRPQLQGDWVEWFAE